jgi:hypothetical protein
MTNFQDQFATEWATEQTREPFGHTVLAVKANRTYAMQNASQAPPYFTPVVIYFIVGAMIAASALFGI